MNVDQMFSESRRKKIAGGLEDRLKLLHDQVAAVAQGYTNALFVYGPGGLGKTHHITTQLEALCGKSWRHHTAYSTPKALMMAMTEHPDSVHLFEDCEKLYKTDVAASLLRAACGSPKQKDRWVTYETAHECLRILFRGGLIIVSNENISRGKGVLAAVASRFRPVVWDMSIEERATCILDIAKSGWAKGAMTLSPDQCQVVARFLVEEMIQGKVQVPVDLRTYTEHALPAYCQSVRGDSKADWKDMILSKLQGSLTLEERREDKSSRLQSLALAIANDKTLNGSAKIAAWKEKSGLGQAIYYRHLKEAKRAQK